MKKISRLLASTSSIKFRLKEKKNRLKELIRLACIWRWQLARLPDSNTSDFAFYYLGRKSERETAIAILGLHNMHAIASRVKERVLVSEIPIPGAICLPQYLTTIIPLKNRTIDEVLMQFEKRKRRFINHSISDFQLIKVTEAKDVVRLNEQMIRPYASARYGEGVYHIPLDKIKEMAFNTGQFSLLLNNGEEFGCIYGHISERNHMRYWQSNRAGFPEAIFSDKHRYREINIIITYLEIKWALEKGLDYYDMGANVSFVEGGVVHFKRTFGGVLSPTGNYNYLYLKPPTTDVAQFYWDRPLFALEDKLVVLHLGFPDKIDIEEASNRYKQLNFGGLSKVYLHCDTQCKEGMLEVIRSIYSYQKSPPLLKCVTH